MWFCLRRPRLRMHAVDAVPRATVFDAPHADGRRTLVPVGEEKVLVVRVQLDLVVEVLPHAHRSMGGPVWAQASFRPLKFGVAADTQGLPDGR